MTDISTKDISVPLIKQQENFARALRLIRTRLDLTQADLALKLGRNQNTISSYEKGKLQPSNAVLLETWKLADHTEKHLLRAYVSELFSFLDRNEQEKLLSMVIDGGPVDRIGDISTTSQRVAKNHEIMDAVPAHKRNDAGVRRFTSAVALILVECETVDPSVSAILDLWRAHSSNPEAASYFRDALGFLRARLFEKS